jgi:hypothetical protein
MKRTLCTKRERDRRERNFEEGIIRRLKGGVKERTDKCSEIKEKEGRI